MPSLSMRNRFAPPLSALAFMWLLELIDWILPGTPLDYYGIRPRVIGALVGIIFAPFLHGGFGHLLANSVPLLVLGLLVTARRSDDFPLVFAHAAFIGGVGTWLFGAPNSIHIGASGIVFGLFAFLIARGFFERSVSAVLLSVVAAVLYGGMLWSLIPVQSGVSWSGHLFGFIGGVVAARSMAAPTRRV